VGFLQKGIKLYMNKNFEDQLNVLFDWTCFAYFHLGASESGKKRNKFLIL
jgi:hypothetical protein